jgi:hypothetical protein
MESRPTNSVCRARIPVRSVNTRWLTEHIADMRSDLTAISVMGTDSSKSHQWLEKRVWEDSLHDKFQIQLLRLFSNCKGLQIIVADCGVQDYDVVVSSVSEEATDGGCRFFLNICRHMRDKQCHNREKSQSQLQITICEHLVLYREWLLPKEYNHKCSVKKKILVVGLRGLGAKTNWFAVNRQSLSSLFLILVCEAIGTAATPGLLCQPWW